MNRQVKPHGAQSRCKTNKSPQNRPKFTTTLKRSSKLNHPPRTHLRKNSKLSFSSQREQPNGPQFELPFHTLDDVFGANRSHYISDLDALPDGTQVSISGWVDRIRPMGQLFFAVLRDSTGTVQATFEKHEIENHEEIFNKINTQIKSNPQPKRTQKKSLYGDGTVGFDHNSDDNGQNNTIDLVDFDTVGQTAYDTGMTLGPEYVVSIKGILQSRPDDMIKKEQQLGSKEIRIRSLRLLNTSKPLPISIHDEFEKTNEDFRMKHRYLDLRRYFNQYVIKLRSQLTMQARMSMYLLGFQEIETPYLVKSTPEGAREFLVPSRNAGKFYALPQSPQQFKQLLMCGGFDKYFQIARCFRDESGRQDRQPEFTQLDLELSFTTPDMVMKSVETMVNSMHLQTYGVPMKELKKIRYIDVMNRFGSDKPDIRYSSELHDLTHYFTDYLLDQGVNNNDNKGLLKRKKVIVQNDQQHGQNNEEEIGEEISEEIAVNNIEEFIQNASYETLQDETVSNLLKIYPPFLHAQHQLKTTGQFGHFIQEGTQIDQNTPLVDPTKPNEIKLKIPIKNEQNDQVSGHKIKPLARHPFPVVKMIIARDLNDVLSKGKNKTIMDKILRDCKEGSNGLMPMIVSCNKWNKIKSNQFILNQKSIQDKLTQNFNLQNNDLLFILTGDWENVCNGLGKIRSNLKTLFKEGSVELLPAFIDGERITPPERLVDGQAAAAAGGGEINLNPFTRFDDYLVHNDWKTQHAAFFEPTRGDGSKSGLFSSRKVLNQVGPLPTFHWVVDFPLFEPNIPSSLYQRQHDISQNKPSVVNDDGKSAEAVSINAMHHPFTAPNPEDLDEFSSIITKFTKQIKLHPETGLPMTSTGNTPVQTNNDPITGYPLDLVTVSQQLGQIRALHYDLVSNGLEVGGGSIRLHQPQLQRHVFDFLQVPHEKFNHLLQALELGAPPHGGFAAGLDRLVAIFGSQHPQGDPLKLKDVIAFPKSSTGNDLLLGTPNEQTKEQLDEYSIMVKEIKKE
jgi:aspartyl-tRNA synthetase